MKIEERLTPKKLQEGKQKKKNMSARAKRELRKYWRNRKRAEAEQKKILKATNGENVLDTPQTHQAISGRKKKVKNLAKCYYTIKVLQAENEKLRRNLNRYRVRLCREKAGNLKRFTKSPRSKLNALIHREKLKVSPKVRRQLLLNDAVKEDVTSAILKSTRKVKREFLKVMSFKFLKKYHFLAAAKPFFEVSIYENRRQHRRHVGTIRKAYATVKKFVVKFYQQDDVSTITPGKRDYITCKKVQKQKRYLCHSLKYLHRKFCEEN